MESELSENLKKVMNWIKTIFKESDYNTIYDEMNTINEDCLMIVNFTK